MRRVRNKLRWNLAPYDAILFDFDGVLVDSEPLHYRCWRDLLAPFGFDLDWDTYAATCIGIPDRLMLAEFSSRTTPPVPLEDLLAVYPAKRERFRHLIAQDLPFFQGCDNFLASLCDYKLGVVSSSGRSEIEPALERAGIRQHFEVLVCGGDVSNHKPHPEPYLVAAKRLRVKAPLVIEDSEAGERSARAAGFDVIRVKSPQDVPGAVRDRLRSMGTTPRPS